MDAVTHWLNGPDVGLSSRCLIQFLAYGRQSETNYPRDPGDLGRCVRALDQLPHLREHLMDAAVLSPEWAELIRHWDALEALYREEAAGRAGAPKTYHAMRKVIDAAQASHEIDGKALLDDYQAPAPSSTSKKNEAYFVLDLRELSIMEGRSLESAALIMKGIMKDYESPCIDCGRKRTVYMDGLDGPTPVKNKCHECATKSAVRSL